MEVALVAAFDLFLKTERDWNRKLKRAGWHRMRANFSQGNKAQFFQGLIQGATLQTAHDKKLRSFNQILTRLLQGLPLGSKV